MLAVLRGRNFTLLWLGQLVSQVGDMVLMVALPFYIYQLTGSLLQTGLMYIVETLPRMLLGSLAGVFVDRWDRRWTMIISDFGRAAVLLLLLATHSPASLWLVYAVACVQSIISLFFAPALSATTPTLVPKHHLVAANSLHSLNESVMRLVGPPLGGALLALVGLTGVVMVDSASFVFSATMLLLIVVPKPERPITTSPHAARIGVSWAQVWQEWLEGLRLVREQRILTAIFMILGLFALSQGFSAAPLVVFVREVMGGSALTLGWMAMAQGVGSLIGVTLIGRASAHLHPAYLVGAPLIIAGCIVLLFVNIPALSVVLPLITLMGIFIVGFFVATQTLIQLNTADQYRGRVASALGTTMSAMALLGICVSSALGDRVGAVGLLEGAGSLNALTGVVALALLRGVKIEKQPLEAQPEPLPPPATA